MVKIELLNPFKNREPDTAVDSVNKLLLGLLAFKLAKISRIDQLIARTTYSNSIDTLNYQTQTALDVLNSFSHRVLLADEVGLGKTIEAGIILKEFITRKLAKKILILTPANLKIQWQEEIKSKFKEDFIVAKSPEDYENEKVIASIDTAKTKAHMDMINKYYWDMLIVDEAHKLKNTQTHNYKLVKSIQKERFLMLTATPLQNNILELWALIDLLHPGYLGTKAAFIKNYVADKDGLKMKNKKLLKKKLSAIMIRNIRSSTGIKFAKREVKTHLLTFSDEEFKFYQAVIGFVRTEYTKLEKTTTLKESEELSEEELKKMAASQKGMLTFRLIMLTRQLTSSIRTGINALERYSENLKDTKELSVIIENGKQIKSDKKFEKLLKILKSEKGKVIIFTTFIKTQKNLETELAINGHSSVLFNGKMNSTQKEDAIEEFRMQKKILLCTDAGSEGRNLQFANVIINYDLPWNPMRIEQRIGRVHRLGQKKKVIVHNLATRDTIETYILNRLYEKIDLFHVTIGEMDLILSQLKKKGSIEQTVFEAAINNDDGFAHNFSNAQKTANKIKKIDEDFFNNE